MVLIGMAIGVAAGVAGPKLLGDGTDLIYDGVTGTGVDFVGLSRILLTALAIYLVAAAVRFMAGLVVRSAVQNTGFRFRREVAEKVDRIPLSYLDSKRRGDLMSRMTNDVDNVTDTLQQSVTQVFDSVLTVLGVLAMMTWMSWRLTLLALIVIPLGALAAAIIAKKAQPQFYCQWEATGEVGAVVEEAYTGHQVAQAYGLGDELREQFSTANEKLFGASFKAQAISSLMPPVMMLVGNLSYVVVAVGGGFQVISGALSIGAVQAFIQYSRQFSQPIAQLASIASLLQSGLASVERIFDFLDAPEMDQELDSAATREGSTQAAGPAHGVTDDGAKTDANAGETGAFAGGSYGNKPIVFDHVRFGYSPDKVILHDMNLTVNPGEMVAIVGPTGAGKTTLVNLVMRFYELDSGSIRIGSTPISQISKDELRSHIGMVLQETWLFHGTIAENIAFGARHDVTRDDIVAAAKAAQADRFIRQLPEGYDTVIDDEGGSLSVGERQLLTIARVFISRPDILILDEATSSVDTRTERVVKKAMDRLRQGRTSFVIAHRLSTIVDADVILVLQDGDVVEQGRHDELLAQDGAYRQLYQAQFSVPQPQTLPLR